MAHLASNKSDFDTKMNAAKLSIDTLEETVKGHIFNPIIHMVEEYDGWLSDSIDQAIIRIQELEDEIEHLHQEAAGSSL